VTFTAPSSGPSGTFAGNLTSVTVLTNAGGVAVAPTFTANGEAGSYVVTASLSGGVSPVTFELTNLLPYSIPAASPMAAFGLAVLLAGAALGILGLRKS